MDTSKSDNFSQNLTYYLNDYDETQLNFISLRVTGNLSYTNVISGNLNSANLINLLYSFNFTNSKIADFSQTEQQLNDQFDKIFNDLQHMKYFFKSKNLILTSKQSKCDVNLVSIHSSYKTCSELYNSYFPSLQKSTAAAPTESTNKVFSLKNNLIVINTIKR